MKILKHIIMAIPIIATLLLAGGAIIIFVQVMFFDPWLVKIMMMLVLILVFASMFFSRSVDHFTEWFFK